MKCYDNKLLVCYWMLNHIFFIPNRNLIVHIQWTVLVLSDLIRVVSAFGYIPTANLKGSDESYARETSDFVICLQSHRDKTKLLHAHKDVYVT